MSEDTARTSTAHIATERGARYGKQLASHLGRRLPTEWDEDSGTGSVWFDTGRCQIAASPDELVLTTDVQDATELEHVEDVVGRHLVRFGSRDELVLTWVRPHGSEGRTYRHADPPPDGHVPPE